MLDRCICCGAIIPEGRQVCPNCMVASNEPKVTIKPDGIHELSTHKYKLDKRLKNVTIEILRCERCGEVSIGWYRQDDTEEVE